jgi:hypothetical protein
MERYRCHWASGGWTVMDRITGRPAALRDEPQINLDEASAQAAALELNALHQAQPGARARLMPVQKPVRYH